MVDEAQDIFDKGIDHVIKALLKVNNPLQNGRYYIFYDDSQDYPGSDDLGYYVRTRDMFKANAASYALTASLRVNTGHGISELINDASAGRVGTDRDYGEDVVIREWNDPVEALQMIRQAVTGEKAVSGFGLESIMVLFSFDLLKEPSPFTSLLAAENAFELLRPDNCGEHTNKIRYTTVLKAKGLERDVIIIVCSSLRHHLNSYQLFIGASRAKAKVYLLIQQ